MEVKLTKLSEAPQPRHPNNIEVGFVRVFNVPQDFFRPPTVGERFNLYGFSTSVVQEILDDNTFRTFNSIYKWNVTNG